jgi:hypothetical protein
MHAAEIGLDLIAVEVDGRRDDMARPFMADLDDVFAEVRLRDVDAFGFERGVQRDLLRHHGLALGDAPGSHLAADAEHDVAGVLGGCRPMNDAAGRGHLLLIRFQVKVEMGQRVILDVLCRRAEGIEFRKRVACAGTLADEAATGVLQRALKIGVGQRCRGIGLEGVRGGLHGVVSITRIGIRV